MTIIPDHVAEQVLDIYTLESVYLSLHTDQPDKTGGFETGVLSRVEVTPGKWSEYVDAAGTIGEEPGAQELENGRQTNTTERITWPAASGGATLTHLGVWLTGMGVEPEDFLGAVALEEAFAVETGDEPYIDTGNLLLMVFGIDIIAPVEPEE